jgi:hypothetical protein
MKREVINSVHIKSIWYGRYSSKLEIEFSNWEIFQYKWVPSIIYDWIMSANCYFTYFENFIKNIYDFRKVDI